MDDQATLRSFVPAVLRPLLPPLFDRPKTLESRATCDNCAMCPKEGQPEIDGLEFFKPSVKCCTFEPTLANFAVGAVFADPSPELDEARKRLRAKIATRVGVTPHHVTPPRKYVVLLNASKIQSFGRSEKMLCPYFDDGKCTIWAYRNGVCSTFFCKHERGSMGRKMYFALGQWLRYVDMKVSAWAAKRVDPTTRMPTTPPEKLTPEDMDDLPPKERDYRSWWTYWVGREEAFYRACYERVKNELTAEELKDIVNDDQGKQLFEILAHHVNVAARPSLEPRLVLNEKVKMQRVEGGVAVIGYSAMDVQFFEEGLYEVCEQMKPDELVIDFLERMKKEQEIEVAPELLLHLQMFDVLVPPPKPEPPKEEPDRKPPELPPDLPPEPTAENEQVAP